MKIMILYYSKTGHTLEAAKAVAEGIGDAGAELKLVEVSRFDPETLTDVDGLIVGSPCWAGSITSGGVASPIKKALKSLPDDCLRGKRSGGFAVHAKIGGKTTLKSLGKWLQKKGCTDFSPAFAAKAGTPASLTTGPAVTDQDLARFKAFGTQFVA